jgi:hypothetical protein
VRRSGSRPRSRPWSDPMSPADLATLSLLDPNQGVCPNGHPCRLSDAIGERECSHGEYRGLALICWDITMDEVDRAERAGADATVMDWARKFLANA